MNPGRRPRAAAILFTAVFLAACAQGPASRSGGPAPVSIPTPVSTEESVSTPPPERKPPPQRKPSSERKPTSASVKAPDTPQVSEPEPAAGSTQSPDTMTVVRSDSDIVTAHREASLGSTLREEEVGYFLDLQIARLQQVGREGAAIERQGDRILIGVPGEGAFVGDSALLEPEAASMLDSLAAVLVEYPQSLIAIGGFIESPGAEADSQSLAEQRAVVVGEHLVSQGVDRGRIVGRGFGTRQSMDATPGASGRVANGRVEIVLWPLVAGE